MDYKTGELEYNINKNTKSMVSKIFNAANDGDQVLFQQLLDEVEEKAQNDVKKSTHLKKISMNQKVNEIADLIDGNKG